LSVGRTTDLTLGSEQYSISTELSGGKDPVIETLILRRGEVVSRTTADAQDLRPIFQHGEELGRRIDAQHESVVTKLKRGELVPVSDRTTVVFTAPEERLRTALSFFRSRAYEEAARELEEILKFDPDFREAREIASVVESAGRGEMAPPANASERIRAGAEAYADGRPHLAIEHWKGGVLSDPANRLFPLLVFIAASGASAKSIERKKRYLEELLATGQQYLEQNQPDDAYALFLIAQTAEAGSPAGEGPASAPRTAEWEVPDDSTVTGESAPVAAAGVPGLEDETVLDLDIPPARPARANETLGVAPPPNFSPEGETAGAAEPASFSFQETFLEEAPAETPANPETPAVTVNSERVEELFGNAVSPAPPTGTPNAEAAKAAAPAKTLTDTRRASPRPAAVRAPVRRHSGTPAWLLYGGLAAGLVLAVVAALVFFGRGGAPGAGERLAEADGLLSTGQYQRAAAEYSRLLAEQSDLAPAYRGRGRARLAAGEIEEGLADLARAAELSGSPDVIVELAGALFDRGRFEEAAARYENAIKRGGDNGEARYHLAASLYQLGRTNEALPHLEAALAKDAKLGEARFLYGKLLNLHSRHAEAEQEIRKAESSLQMRGEFYAELGVALLEQGKVEPAEIVARDFARFDGNDARAHSLLGEVFLRKKQLEPAREELIKALTLNPIEPRAQIALGRTWLALGDGAKARQILTGAKGVPEGERLLVLGQVTLAEGKTEEAIRSLEQALATGVKPLPVRLALAGARYSVKDFAGAAGELEHAVGLAPSDPAIPLSLALVYSELKDATKASQQFLEALKTAGLSAGGPGANGPVVLPAPYVPLPPRFDLTRLLRATYTKALSTNAEDASALALKTLAESSSFVIGQS